MENNIIQQFKNIANKYPQKVALICGDLSVKYSEMKKEVLNIAYSLRINGVKAGDMVAICLPHTTDFVMAVMAVLECGAIYVPIEYHTPDGRTRVIIENYNIKWMISEKRRDVNVKIMYYKDLKVSYDVKLKQSSQKTVDQPQGSGKDSAYVIFTSGSTGVPKGIEIMNDSVCHLVKAYSKYLNPKSYRGSHKVLLMASFSFDMSVFQMFYPLLTGQTLDVLPEKIKENPTELLEYIKRHKISVMDVTPLYLDSMTECMKVRGEYYIPKFIISSGEALPLMTARRWFQNKECKESIILNSYGPTEACVYTSVFKIDRINVEYIDKMLIGIPLDGYQIHILNEYQKPCAVDEIGELYITGKGLAKGYLNQAKLTENTFVKIRKLFGSQRLYRTGDFGCVTQNGMIYYAGRKGEQVKIHGYRVELGEIEHQMQNIQGILKSRVIVQGEEKERKIIAYFIADKGIRWTAEALDDYLKDFLPHYMIPHYYVPVEHLKRTVRGKLDRNSLPDYQTYMLKRKKGQTSNNSKDSIYFKIESICKQLLNLNEINPEMSFLEQGGTSIHYFSLSAEIQSQMRVMIRPSELMKMSDIYTIADAVRKQIMQKKDKNSNVNVDRVSTVSGTTAFQRLLFTEEKKTQKLVYKYGIRDFPMYNVIYSVSFDEVMDAERLRLVIAKLIEENDALHSRFINNSFNILEMRTNEVDVRDAFEQVKVASVTQEGIVYKVIKKFDISKTPLFRITMLNDDEGKQRFIMNFHHAVFDYFSMRIFMEQLLRLYYKSEQEKTGSFLNYIINSNQQKNVSDIHFWKRYYRDRKSKVCLKGDISIDGIHNMICFTTQKFRIESENYQMIRNKCQKIGITVYGLMFACYAKLLMELTQSCDIIIGTYMNSRDGDGLTNVRTIGLITSMVGVRFRYKDGDTSAEFLRNVEEDLNTIRGHLSLGYNEVYTIMEEKDLMQGKLFDIVFNYIVQGSVHESISGHDYVFEEIGEESISLPLALKGFEDCSGITFKLKYCSEIYSELFIERFVYQYINTIEKIIGKRLTTDKVLI